MSDTILERLESSRQVVTAMIQVAAEDTSARFGAWSLRDVAAHLAASELECYEPRIHAIAAGEEPRFDFYTNDDRDFSGVQLEDALAEWAATRARLLGYVGGLTDEERARLGHHERYGAISVDRYLEVALEHDRDHLVGLERVAGELKR